MKKYLCFVLGMFFPLFTMGSLENGSLVNEDYICNTLTYEAVWSHSHNAFEKDLGAGMLYYALVYSTKAKLCVCLGSGGGFVPRVMRQAQRDMKIPGSKTVLVDANIGTTGSPTWLHKHSFFRKNFPEIEILIKRTHDVALNEAQSWKIDYLHIDADRTFHGAYQDFIDYLPMMAPGSVITLHDTGNNSACCRVAEKIRELGYEVINFDHLGSGVAVIHIR